jgi:hypothetical protein
LKATKIKVDFKKSSLFFDFNSKPNRKKSFCWLELLEKRDGFSGKMLNIKSKNLLKTNAESWRFN